MKALQAHEHRERTVVGAQNTPGAAISFGSPRAEAEPAAVGVGAAECTTAHPRWQWHGGTGGAGPAAGRNDVAEVHRDHGKPGQPKPGGPAVAQSPPQ
jgi:hypothetical protein